MKKQEPKIYDFIIVGSGIAGLNAALRGAEKGSVLLITKQKLKTSNTWYAQGGIAAVLQKQDSFKKHIDDTLKAGCYHNSIRAVEYIISQSPSAIKRLQSLGVTFTKKTASKGESIENIALHREGGHSENRIVHAFDHTGQSIEEAAMQKVHTSKNITILEHCYGKDLLVKNNTCYGIEALYKKKIQHYYGKIVILATGGVGQVYGKTTNPKIATGDGIAMAYRAGAKLKDLEFIQFHPTALDEKSSPQFLLSEALRGEGAVLINEQGEAFMKKYHPLKDLAPRDIVSRAIVQEKMRSSKRNSYNPIINRQKIFLDVRHIKNLKQKFPHIYKTLLKKGFSPLTTPIPVIPVAHYSCGGVVTDRKGQSSIKDLYGFGEVSCTGLHGANRLASNSLLEAVVMSEQIQWISLPTKKVLSKFIKSKTLMPLSTLQKKTLSDILQKIKTIMDTHVGIIRTKKSLRQAIRELKMLTINNVGAPQQIEVENVRQTAILIAKAALSRKKSLGCHYLQD